MKKSGSFKVLCMFTALSILFAITPVNLPADAEEINQYVSLCIGYRKAIQNGIETTIDKEGSKPFILNGRTMIPLRFVSEKMGAKVTYVSQSEPITVVYKPTDTTVTFTLNSKKMTITTGKNKKTVTIDTPAQIKNGRTFIPLRAIGQALGFQVYYDDATKIIIVSNPKMTATIKKNRIDEAKKKIRGDLLIGQKAEKIKNKMTLDEKIYQLFFVTPESITGVKTVTQAGDTTKKALKSYPVGGIIYFSANIKTCSQVSDMISKTQSYSKTPLFIGVDEEGGRVARISGNPQMGFEKIDAMEKIGKTGDPKKSYAVGKKIAANISPLGFNVDFAPVADIITNPKNTEIGDRSFGKDPELVSRMIEQQVLGLQAHGIGAALKHFPGHGSTQADTHKGYSESFRTLKELRATEFLPFQAGIQAGADFVLMSHMSLVHVNKSKIPASLSKKIVTDILKTELSFNHLVITDSLSMGAITSRYTSAQTAVMALEAGVDMLLMPKNLKDAFAAIKAAVASGKISEKRIDESVLKILQVKIDRNIIQ